MWAKREDRNSLQNGDYHHDVDRTGIDALTYDCLTTKGRQRKGQSKQREALPENAQQGTPTTGQERPHNARIPPCSGRALWRGIWRNHFLAGAAWLREDRAWKHPASATAHTRHGHEHRHKAKHSKIERPRETQAQASSEPASPTGGRKGAKPGGKRKREGVRKKGGNFAILTGRNPHHARKNPQKTPLPPQKTPRFGARRGRRRKGANAPPWRGMLVGQSRVRLAAGSEGRGGVVERRAGEGAEAEDEVARRGGDDASHATTFDGGQRPGEGDLRVAKLIVGGVVV